MRTVALVVLAGLVVLVLIASGMLIAEIAKPAVVPTIVFPTPLPTSTPMPTPTNFPTPTPPPTATPAVLCPPPATLQCPTPFCGKHGQVVWEIPDKKVEQEISFGSIDENCWIAGWVKTGFPKLKIWLFAVPPQTVASFKGFQAGKAWFVGGNRTTVKEFLDQLADNFDKEDKDIEIQTIIFPEDCGDFPFLTHFQSRWSADP